MLRNIKFNALGAYFSKDSKLARRNLNPFMQQNNKHWICSAKVLKFIICWAFIIESVFLLSCNWVSNHEQTPVDPLFANSIVSTDVDFITKEDSSVFTSLEYIGQVESEMPDKRNNKLMDKGAFVFSVNFSDGNNVEIWTHSDFGSAVDAEKFAHLIGNPLGKLPEIMRKKLKHVVIHKGNETAFGESEGNFFVLYSQNMLTRIMNNDLEETVFHESVHATLETTYRNNKKWLEAQEQDNAFITEYAASQPDLEDLPETALFAYTMIKYPGRLSSNIENWILKNTPNKLVFFKTVFE